MSWTYSGNPKDSQLDELRFILQDTNDAVQLLQNEELQYLIDQLMTRYDSLTWVASVAAAVVSRKFAGKVSVSAEGVSVNVSDISPRYSQMAADLRREHARNQITGEGVDIDNVLLGHTPDPSIEPTMFGMRLHDNPEAGLQDYGGALPDPFGIAEQLMFDGYFV